MRNQYVKLVEETLLNEKNYLFEELYEIISLYFRLTEETKDIGKLPELIRKKVNEASGGGFKSMMKLLENKQLKSYVKGEEVSDGVVFAGVKQQSNLIALLKKLAIEYDNPEFLIKELKLLIDSVYSIYKENLEKDGQKVLAYLKNEGITEPEAVEEAKKRILVLYAAMITGSLFGFKCKDSTDEWQEIQKNPVKYAKERLAA